MAAQTRGEGTRTRGQYEVNYSLVAQTRGEPTGTRRRDEFKYPLSAQTRGEATGTRRRYEVHFNSAFENHDEMPLRVTNPMRAQTRKELTGTKIPYGTHYKHLGESSGSDASNGSGRLSISGVSCGPGVQNGSIALGISGVSSGSASSNGSDESGPDVTLTPYKLLGESSGSDASSGPKELGISGVSSESDASNGSGRLRISGVSSGSGVPNRSNDLSISGVSSGSASSNGSDVSGPDVTLTPCKQPDKVLVPETNRGESPEIELDTIERPRLRNQTTTYDSQTHYDIQWNYKPYQVPVNNRRESHEAELYTIERQRLRNQTTTYGSQTHCDIRWNYKMLVPIISCLLIAAATVLIVLLYTNDDYNQPYTEECSHEVAHFGSKSIATCIYQYSTIAKVDIITLKTKQGEIDFPNPFKNNSMENGTESNATEITSEDWTLKFNKKDKKTIELFFVTNITDCNLMGDYEVLLKESGNEILTLPFVIDIAGDYTPTIAKINAYIDDGSVTPTVELDCEGILYCKQYLFYGVNVNDGEQGLIRKENMNCTLNKSKSGVVKASCSNRWTDSELLNKKNTILSCTPSVPSDVNKENISLQEVHGLDEMKDLCTNHLTAGFGNRLQYFCKKRLTTTDLDTTVIEVEFLKDQVHILNSTIPTDGTSHNTSKGRYRLHGHLEGDLLALNITFNEVYHCDGGVYVVRITNASDIRFELSLPESKSNTCKSEIQIPWQQEKKSTCQFCSEKDVSLYYEINGSQIDAIPSEGVVITNQFTHGLVTLDLHVKNMSCHTYFLIHVFGEVNRTISLITEGPFFGNVEKTFSNDIGINHTMFFRHFLGCFAKITLPLVTGQAVVHHTENITYSPHNGIILDHFVLYQTQDVFNGSLVSSVVTYTDSNMTVKRSEDHFIVIHIPGTLQTEASRQRIVRDSEFGQRNDKSCKNRLSKIIIFDEIKENEFTKIFLSEFKNWNGLDAFCAQKKDGCNYKHPSFNDRFVSCPSNMSLPVEQHCVEGTIWDDPDGDCLGRCE